MFECISYETKKRMITLPRIKQLSIQKHINFMLAVYPFAIFLFAFFIASSVYANPNSNNSQYNNVQVPALPPLPGFTGNQSANVDGQQAINQIFNRANNTQGVNHFAQPNQVLNHQQPFQQQPFQQSFDMQALNSYLAAQPQSPQTQEEYDALRGTGLDPSFQQFIQGNYPLTPEQIRIFREIYESMLQASVVRVNDPTPTLTTLPVSLQPGSVPPVIKMGTGFVSSVVFLDSSGAPWPIASYSIGTPSAFNIEWDPESNVMLIQGMAPYQSTNMALQLAGLSTPVLLTLVNDQQEVYYRVDLRVPGQSPLGSSYYTAGATAISDTSPVLMDLLDGISPVGSERLTVTGGSGQAWMSNNKLYLRTKLPVISPSWHSTVSSADGTKVYEFDITSLILASDGGNLVSLRIEGL